MTDLTELSELELSTKLQDVIRRRVDFETQLRAVKSYYFEAVYMRLDIRTNDFNDKGTDKPIQVTKDIFTEYLNREIAHLVKEAHRIVEELAKPIA